MAYVIYVATCYVVVVVVIDVVVVLFKSLFSDCTPSVMSTRAAAPLTITCKKKFVFFLQVIPTIKE